MILQSQVSPDPVYINSASPLIALSIFRLYTDITLRDARAAML